MHTTKKEKKNYIKGKIPLRYSSHSRNSTFTTKTTPEIQTLQERHLQEGNNAQAPLSPVQKILGFHPEDSLRS
jgi:hypothetical protein